MSNRRIHPWIAAALLWMLALGARAQGPTFQYFYDDSGQLTKVVDATGIVIVYVYDPAGNMVEIKRTVGSSGTLSILSFAPGQGGPLIPVTIRGQGFSATPSENTVQFNGISATVLSASTATLVATVPINAVTGPISVTVAGTTATSSTNFVVTPSPVITSLSPIGALANSTLSLVVTGVNLTSSSFKFLPAFATSSISIGTVSINPTGTSATLTLTVAANVSGQFTLVATNPFGSSNGFPTTGNTFTVVLALSPAADSDNDGLSDTQETNLGTDPFNSDTDGDGYSDGVEVASGSNPFDRACTPLNCKSAAGEADSATFSDINTATQTSSLNEVDGVTFSVLNAALPSGSLSEADSVTFSACNGTDGCPGFGRSTSVAKHLPKGKHSTPDPGKGPSPTASANLDSDGDGLSDDVEQRLGTNPLNTDTDGDGFPDGLEVALGSDPLDANSIPDIRPPTILIEPVIDIENLGTAIQPAGRRFQPENGERYAAQLVAAHRHNSNFLVRLRSLFR